MARKPPPARRKRVRRHIHKGSLCYDKHELLVSLTSIRSKKQIRALESHLVQGFDIHQVCEMFGVTSSNLNRDILKLNRMAATIHKYIEIENGN